MKEGVHDGIGKIMEMILAPSFVLKTFRKTSSKNFNLSCKRYTTKTVELVIFFCCSGGKKKKLPSIMVSASDGVLRVAEKSFCARSTLRLAKSARLWSNSTPIAALQQNSK